MTAPDLINYEYILSTGSPNNEWTHDDGVINASSDTIRDLCGGISYALISDLNNGALDNALSYVSSEKKFTILTGDRDLLPNQPYDYGLRVYLTNFPTVEDSDIAQISIFDACLNPDTLSIGAYATNIEYKYIESAEWDFPEITTTPDTC